MTYQEASTEQLLLWLAQARSSRWLADFAERDWAKYVAISDVAIQECSAELTARGVAHETTPYPLYAEPNGEQV